MSGPNDELREAVEEIVAAARRDAHPDPERLAAYHAGELPLAEAERLQDHLVACRECSGLLLDLDRLADPLFGAETIPEATKDDLWRRVLAGVRREDAPPAPVVPIRRPSSSLRPFQALAAALLIATLGLSLWVASLRRTVGELSRPQVNAPVVDLYAGTVRGETSAPVPSIPPDMEVFTVVLNPAGHRSEDGYRLEIARQGGAVVWNGEGLKPNAFGSLSLTLSRRLLPPGDYRFRLFGRTGGNERRIEEYVLRVEGR
ncbi:MAG TPA: zf-HC2 domain-containing protein [Thermoanaerobaculia bacterium]